MYNFDVGYSFFISGAGRGTVVAHQMCTLKIDAEIVVSCILPETFP